MNFETMWFLGSSPIKTTLNIEKVLHIQIKGIIIDNTGAGGGGQLYIQI